MLNATFNLPRQLSTHSDQIISFICWNKNIYICTICIYICGYAAEHKRCWIVASTKHIANVLIEIKMDMASTMHIDDFVSTDKSAKTHKNPGVSVENDLESVEVLWLNRSVECNTFLGNNFCYKLKISNFRRYVLVFFCFYISVCMLFFYASKCYEIFWHVFIFTRVINE